MVHAVFSRDQQAIVAEGDSTIVVFDYQANRPHPIPEARRAAMANVEGRTFVVH